VEPALHLHTSMHRVRSPAITAFATLLVLATAASSALGAVPQSTVQALRDLWEQTGGPYWSDECWVGSTWNDTDPCDPSSPWTLTQNVVCDASGSAVTELGLPSCNLTGTLPASIGDLVNLTVLEFETNQLSGPIPREIGNLVNLQYLDLYVAPATTICKQRHDCEHYSLLSSLSSIVRVEHMLTILKSNAGGSARASRPSSAPCTTFFTHHCTECSPSPSVYKYARP
jgi:hypothetical protein